MYIYIYIRWGGVHLHIRWGGGWGGCPHPSLWFQNWEFGVGNSEFGIGNSELGAPDELEPLMPEVPAADRR